MKLLGCTLAEYEAMPGYFTDQVLDFAAVEAEVAKDIADRERDD